MATSRDYVFLKDSPAQWTATDPVLDVLTVGIEKGTGFFKIGNGVQKWSLLPYVVTLGNKAVILDISQDSGNIIKYGTDGGLFLAGNTFDGVETYVASKRQNPGSPPVDPFKNTIFSIGRDIFNVLLTLSNVEHKVNLLTNAATINDNNRTANDATWSIVKIIDELLLAKEDVKNDLLNNHAEAYNALVSLSQLLAQDPNLATSISTELSRLVSFAVEQQLTTAQKEQARINIDAVGKGDLGQPFDSKALFESYTSTVTEGIL